MYPSATVTRAAKSSRLQPTTLEISRGEFVAVVGPSGSGKTTLLSMLGGMLAPTSGKVWLDGESLYDATATRAGAHASAEVRVCVSDVQLDSVPVGAGKCADSADAATALRRPRTNGES